VGRSAKKAVAAHPAHASRSEILFPQETKVKSASQDPLQPTTSSSNYRVACATAVVVALHLALVALVLTKHDRIAVVAPVSHVITAELLQPPTVAAVAAIQSTPSAPPKPAPAVTQVKPKERSDAKLRSAPVPVPVEPGPSHQPVQTQAPAAAPLAATAPAGQAAATSEAPAGKPVMALSVPKNVSHLDCRIVAPDYPTRSKRLGETGTAYVRFVVSLTGQIEDVELKKSSGFDRLDNAALDAMRASACKPYMENGVPMRAAYTQPFDFSLGG
jgi:periplasmic protein TonB